MVVKFGMQQPDFSFAGGPAAMYSTLEQIAREADKLGFDSFWLMDHVIQAGWGGEARSPILEAFVTLGALASATSRVRLGTLVAAVPFRNPALLAKMGSSLDVISGGRFFMGIGGGWLKEEFDAYGWTFPPPKERVGRVEETAQILLKMWTEDHATYSGAYYDIDDAICEPRPLQKPHPPLMIGGGGEQLTLRCVAKYADACNLWGDPPMVRHKLQVLARHCEAVGRDPGSIMKTHIGRMLIARNDAELRQKMARYFPHGLPREDAPWMTVAGTPSQCADMCAQLVDAGITYLIFTFPDAPTLEPLHLFADEVMPALQ